MVRRDGAGGSGDAAEGSTASGGSRALRAGMAVTVLAGALATDMIAAEPVGADTPQSAGCQIPAPAFVNQSYETPNVGKTYKLVPAANSTNPAPTPGIGWSTNDPKLQDEIWASGYNGVPSDSGGQYSELDGNALNAIWQDIPTTPGSTIEWSFAHRGRAGTDVMQFLAGSAGNPTSSFASGYSTLQTASDGTTAWGHYAGTYVVPAGQTTTRFVFNAVSSVGGASEGNFIDSLHIAVAANACADTATALIGQTTGINVLGNDGGDGLTASVASGTTAQGGTVTIDSATGYVDYTPPAGFSPNGGTDTFSYTATDKYGNTSTATVTVTVPPLPKAVNLTSSGPTPQAQTAAVTTPTNGSATLLSGGTATTSVPVDGQGTYTISGSTITFTPVAGFSGTATPVTYRVTDSYGQTASATYTPTVVPAASPASVTVADGQSLSGVVPAASGTGPFTYAVVSGPADGSLVLSSNGSYTYTPVLPFSGPDSFTYTATGAGGTSAPATVTIAVTPTAVGDSVKTTYGTAVSGTSASLLGNDDGTGLTLTSVQSPSSGTVTKTATGYTYTPAAGFSGTATFTYTATDSSGQTETGTVTVTVTPAASPANVTVADGQSLSTSVPVASGSGPFTYAEVSGPTNGALTFNTDGSYIYTPTVAYSGPDSFTYTATGAGGTSTAATVTIAVTPTAIGDSVKTAYQAAVSGTTASLLGNDDGTGLTLTSVQSPSSGSVTQTASGYTYTPAAGFSGTATFTYTATDSSNQTETGTVTVTVMPAASSASVTVADGQSLSTSLPAASGTGSFTYAEGTGPSHGSLILDSDGTYTYTPTVPYSGPDSFTYTATGAGGTAGPATITIAVLPVAVADAVKTTYGTAVSGTSASLLGNDDGTGLTLTLVGTPSSGTVTKTATGYTYTPAAGFSGTATFPYTATDSSDQTETGTVTVTVVPAASPASVTVPDGQTLSAAVPTASGKGPFTYAQATGPSHGSLVFNIDGSYSFTPTVAYSGPDSFTYTATGAGGTSAPATVTIAVTPTAVGDSVKTTYGTAVSGTSASLLGNDDGTGLTLTSVQSPSSGTVTKTATGYTYTPAAGFSGTATFPYTATDSSGQPETGTVTVTVTPAASSASSTVPDGQTLSAAVPTASGKGPFTYAKATGPSHGSLVFNGDGTYSYTPTVAYSGPDSFTYTATGAGGTSSAATVTIAVTPTAVGDSVKTAFQTAVSGTAASLLGNDDGSGLTLTSVQSPSSGSVTQTASGYTYVPASGFSGTATFTYTATDSSGQPETGTVTVTVLPPAPVANDDSGSTTVGVTLTGPSVLTNDTGTKPLTATLATAPATGSLTLRSDGTYTYVPVAGASGVVTFTYYAVDPAGQSSATPATVTITIAPVAGPGAGSVADGQTLSATLPAAAGTGPFSYATATGAAYGTVTVTSGGSYTYSPAVPYSGPDSFTYTATDAAGTTSAAVVVTLTVTPVAVADAVTTAFQTPFSGTGASLVGNDDGSGLALTSVGTPSSGSVVKTSSGYTYTPATGFSGTATFPYTATDSAGQTESGTVTVTVLPPGPVANPDSASGITGIPLTNGANLLTNDTGDGPLTSALATGAAHGTVTVSGNGSWTYTSDTGYSGVDTFTYVDTDVDGQHSAPATVTVAVHPTAAAQSVSTPAGQALGATLPTATGTGPFTYAASTQPSHGTLTLAPGGGYTFTPDSGYVGGDSFSYTATDASGLASLAATVTITVTPPPAPTAADDSGTTPAGTVLHGTGLLSNDSGDGPLTASLDGNPVHGTVTVLSNGSYTYTPDAGYSGPDTFMYQTTDAVGQVAAPGTVSLTVTPVAAPDSYSTTVDTPVTVTAPGVLANDLGTGLTPTVVTSPSHGVLAFAPGGGLTYTPDPGFTGSDSFTYHDTDGSGQVSPMTTVTIGVGTPPAAPVADPDAASTSVGSPVDVPVLTNDTGVGTLTPTVVTDPAHGTAVVQPDGTIRYTPAGGTSGTDTFTYQLADTFGQMSAPTTVTVTVDPTSQPDAATVTGGGTYAGSSVLANDDGTDLTAVLVAGPSHGTLTLAPGGTYTYTPTPGYAGPDTFTYRPKDPDGDLGPVTTVTLRVVEPLPPVASDDTLTTFAGSPVSAPDLLADDTGTEALTAALATPPAHGTATVSPDGAVTYTPAHGFSGTDTFTYTATDAYGRTSAPATVTVAVVPVAAPASKTVTEGSTLSSAIPPVDGTGPFTATATTEPAHGTLVLQPDGSYTYTPTPGYTGPDSFVYTVTGAGGTSKPATVTILVTPAAATPPPSGHGATATTLAGTPYSGSLLGDVHGSGPLTLTVASRPGHGSVTISPAGTYTYTPAPGFSGVDSFTYTVTDAGGTSTPIRVTIVVDPRAAPDAGTVHEDGSLPGSTVLGNDVGVGLHAVLASRPAHGTVALQADGRYVYTPDPGFVGTDHFTYYVRDAAGDLSTATVVTITVLGAAQPAPVIAPPPAAVTPAPPAATLPFTGAEAGLLTETGLGLVGTGILLLSGGRRGRRRR